MRELNQYFRVSFALMIILILVPPLSAQQNKLKIYISVDMEGIGGVVTDHQLGPDGFEYQRFREFMTAEAMTAVTAAKEAGATEILVSDSHGNMENLLIEKFPTDVRIIRGRPRQLGMMAGIDSTFDAVLFIGYHASTNNPHGVRAHTFSSATLTRIAINGKEMTEGSWNAAIAGHFGVPVVMISGDNAAVAEVRAQIGQIEGAVVKNNLGFHSANTLTPQAAQQLITDKVKVSLGRLQEFKPFKVASPLTLDITFKHYQPAQVLAYLPGVERLDAHSIRYHPKDMIEASNFLLVVTSYNPALEP
ncbi:MAG TPA: M55 family metallopeptidase [Acidobacteriota bacterium]|nr:M55 family metallopeptidase [Acidobacteriota bacterium]